MFRKPGGVGRRYEPQWELRRLISIDRIRRGFKLKTRKLAVAAALAAGCLSAATGTATAEPAWAPAASAAVAPGVQTFTGGAQCTSNFVFYDGSNNAYIGQAAHCSGTGGNTETNGCTSGSLPIGTPVDVDGAILPGTLRYNSWLTMEAKGETDPNKCAGNDFALVRLAPADAAKTNPTIPFF